MATESQADVSVVICTRNRADSLCETLSCLAAADRAELAVDVVVVDNGSDDATRAVVQSFAHRLPVRYLFEPTLGTYGKSHALNRALNASGLGQLVAVLDDDMSVEPGWWRGVCAISRRWPNADLFTGRSHVIWPSSPAPEWAGHPKVRGWLCSVMDEGAEDLPLSSGRWFSGNHFWFRSRVLIGGRRFPDTWFTEPQFILQLIEDGFCGVSGADAVAGHRIQPSLLEPAMALDRSVQSGKAIAQARLCPVRRSVRNSRLAVDHPIAARTYCAASWIRWTWRRWRARNAGPDCPGFADRLMAVQQCANYREALRILSTAGEYRLFNTRARSGSRTLMA